MLNLYFTIKTKLIIRYPEFLCVCTGFFRKVGQTFRGDTRFHYTHYTTNNFSIVNKWRNLFIHSTYTGYHNSPIRSRIFAPIFNNNEDVLTKFSTDLPRVWRSDITGSGGSSHQLYTKSAELDVYIRCH